MPTAAATAAAAAALSPVSSIGRRPSSRSPATASALVGLTVSATANTAVAAPSHPASDRGLPGGLGVGPCPRPALGAGSGPSRPAGSAAPATTACPSTTPSTPSPARLENDSTPGSGPTCASARGGDGSPDGVLAGRFERADQPQGLVLVDAVGDGDARRSAMRPVVTVPVLSSTIVSTRWVDSSTSGPRMRIPSWAPRPVPTSRAVGVASPSAQGQAMISTATAAVKASRRVWPVASQPARVSRGEHEDDRARTPPTPGRPAAARRPCRTAPPPPAGRSGPARCRRRRVWRARPAVRRR